MKINIDELIAEKQILQSNNSGPFIIIENISGTNSVSTRCKIKFISTGYENEALFYSILYGTVKDHTLKSYSNIDFDHSRYLIDYDKIIYRRLVTIYRFMIDRCYNPKSEKYPSYGAIGIRVSDEWRNMDQFMIDVKDLYNYDKFYLNPFIYEFDKDYLQQSIPKNQRIYSKETCLFLYYQDNLNLKHLEEMKEHSSRSGYFGVEINAQGNYYARIRMNNHRHNIGTFDNPIAAANAYNYWMLKYHNYELVPLLNDVPYMGPEEFIKHHTAPKLMYKLIDK